MIIISACLAGTPCRYNGKDYPVPGLSEFAKSGKTITLCPEILGGLAVPREPCEIRVSGTGLSVIGKDGKDHTRAFHLGAEKVLEICRKHHIKSAILKSKSPSCGCGIIYDGSFSGTLTSGNGICADLLLKNGISVYTEENWEQIPAELR